MTPIYHIAEMFESIQGEATWSGTPMFFIRLAGCTVGKPIVSEEQFERLGGSQFPIWQHECQTADGRYFLCDTDYRSHRKMTVEELVSLIPPGIKHVCLTGGEPLMHDLQPLLDKLGGRCWVHVETSGTILPKMKYLPNMLWLTVSPKFGVLPKMLQIANEIKLLVDEEFDLSKLPPGLESYNNVWLQPVNGTTEVNYVNVRHCLDLLKQHPSWRLSLQLHKILKVR